MAKDTPTWDAEMLARAVGLKRAGFSGAAIAKRLGVSVSSVENRTSRAGAKRRLDGHGGNRGHWRSRGMIHVFAAAAEVREPDTGDTLENKPQMEI